MLSLILIAGVALLFTFVPRLARHEKIQGILSETEHGTSQTSVRWTMVLLFALLVIAAEFGLDVVLGAFLAGVVLRRWAPARRASRWSAKLDAVGYGFFIPVFFVTSGMSLDLKSIIESPARLVVFFVLFLAVRGLPALLFYRHELPMRGRVQLMLLTATALPLLVALAAYWSGVGNDAARERRRTRRRGRALGHGVPSGRRHTRPLRRAPTRRDPGPRRQIAHDIDRHAVWHFTPNR